MTIDSIRIVCADPAALARFWANVLGYVPATGVGDVSLAGPDERGPRVDFVRGEKTPTIEVPIHLDVNAPDREREVARLLEVGARLVATKTETIGDFSETFTVMRDPERNGFCVQGPDPRAPGRPYIANVTFACADPPRLAEFWGEALAWERAGPPEEFVQKLLAAGLDPAELGSYDAVRDPDQIPPRLLFQRRQKTPAASPPLRLVLVADDVDADRERLTRLGATVARGTDEETELHDPDDNLFVLRAG